MSAGQVVGEGFHPKAGEPHAEVFALRGAGKPPAASALLLISHEMSHLPAGQLARGATAYVTLEPCNHYGRTPPCSRALVDAGVSRVSLQDCRCSQAPSSMTQQTVRRW